MKEKKRLYEGAWRTTERKEQRVPSKRLNQSNTRLNWITICLLTKPDIWNRKQFIWLLKEAVIKVNRTSTSQSKIDLIYKKGWSLFLCLSLSRRKTDLLVGFLRFYRLWDLIGPWSRPYKSDFDATRKQS